MTYMSEYISEVRDVLSKELPKYNAKVELKGKNQLVVIRGGSEIMIIRDASDSVELTYSNNKYTYDKWYTKPQHLAQVVINVLNNITK